MKLLVSVKRVPAPEQPVGLNRDATGIDSANLSFVINPFDAIALEEALRIREGRKHAVEVVAVTIGGSECEEQLRTALAVGADRAILVEAEGGLDPWCVARVLAAVMEREQPQMVLMGKQAIDDDSNQAGQFLAAILDWPQATFASQVEFDGEGVPEAARVTRETDAGTETVTVSLPAVVTVDLRLNEPRYASLPSIIKARKKPIERTSADELGVALEGRVELLRLERAAAARNCVRVADVRELVHRLRHEAKVV